MTFPDPDPRRAPPEPEAGRGGGTSSPPAAAERDADGSRPPPTSPPARRGRFGLLALAFASGFATLVIEIAGARLIAPVYGLSAVPWTAVIGVILTALAVGSHLGGKLADEGSVPLATVLAIGGATAMLPAFGEGVPWLARDALGFVPGAVTSALVLFAPPVLCLGAVVPYLVQADTESLAAVGRRAGDVSAAATAGAIGGTFTTGFVLLPAFPLPVLLGLTAAAMLLMAAASGRVLRGGPRARDLLIVAPLALGTAIVAPRTSAGILHEEQTLYASVQVREREWPNGLLVREMLQNGGSSSAEYVATGEPAHDYVGASAQVLEPVLDGATSMLVLGGAGLSLPVAIQRRHPGLRIQVVELDPVVTRLAEEYFAYGAEPRPLIDVVHEDARVWLRRSTEAFDVVYMDVFDHLVTVPWTMVTVEALTDVAARLRPGGVFAANVLSPLEGPGVAFLERLRATLEEVFEEVRFYRAQPRLGLEVTQNLVVVAGPVDAVPDVFVPRATVASAGRPLTDAWAPVEYLQARVFLGGLGWR